MAIGLLLSVDLLFLSNNLSAICFYNSHKISPAHTKIVPLVPYIILWGKPSISISLLVFAQGQKW